MGEIKNMSHNYYGVQYSQKNPLFEHDCEK